MIYNIIVNTQPAPPDTPPAERKWEYSLIVELEIDSNPQFKMFGQGVILRFDLEGDDWSFSAITDHILNQIREDLGNMMVEEARQISGPLHEGITKAYENPS